MAPAVHSLRSSRRSSPGDGRLKQRSGQGRSISPKQYGRRPASDAATGRSTISHMKGSNDMSNLSKLRGNPPLIVCITNDVVKDITANGLLALGSSPIMSGEKSEAAALMKAADGDRKSVV